MTDTTDATGLQICTPPKCPRCGQPLKDCPECGQPIPPQPDPWPYPWPYPWYPSWPPYPYYVGDPPWWQQTTITYGPNVS